MVLIPFLWCVFALAVVVLVWIALQLHRAVKKEMLAREAITAQLSELHDIDVASAAAKALKRLQ